MNRTIAKCATAGVLTVMPIAAVGIPACAVASPGGTHVVLPAPPPADPANDTPAPSAPQGEYYNPNDWWYNHSADSGGGGGG